MILLDGKKLAEKILVNLEEKVKNQIEQGMQIPHLVVIIVGDNAASKIYVKNKQKAFRDKRRSL